MTFIHIYIFIHQTVSTK